MESVSGTVVVDGELSCFGCLYDLRGLPADGRCPECGAPVAASTRDDRWDHADTVWRCRVPRGLVWAAAECAVVPAWAAVSQLSWPDADRFMPLTFALMAVTGLVGGWKLTAEEPMTPGERSPGRRVARWLTVAAALAYVGVAAGAVLELQGVSIGMAVVIAWCGLNGSKQVALAWYVRGLLARVPGRPLRRSAPVAVAVAPAGWWGFIAAMTVNHLFGVSAFWWRLTVAMLLLLLAGFAMMAMFNLLACRTLRRARR